MKPFKPQVGELTESSQLYIAAAALEAGDRDASQLLLRNIDMAEVRSPDELSGALEMAEALGDDEVFGRILRQMQLAFPTAPNTALAEYRHHFRLRKFGMALDIAVRLGLVAEALLCKAFHSPAIEADEFLSEMEKRGELEQGLITCASEAMFRQMGRKAIEWASGIGEGPLIEVAFELRLRALRIEFRAGDKEFATGELARLMKIVAVRYKDTQMRLELEQFLDFHIEEPVAKAALSAILLSLLNRQVSRDDESIALSKSIVADRDFSVGAQSEAEFEVFMKGCEEMILASPKMDFVFGEGELSSQSASLVGPKLINVIATEASGVIKVDLGNASLLLHVLRLACKAGDDRSTDFLVAQDFVAVTAMSGDLQGGRNMAETVLQFWSDSKSGYDSWRVSQGWSLFTEACLRSHNALAAARYLSLSLLAHEAPALNLELLRRWYRMATRMFRDIGLPPLALNSMQFERELLAKQGIEDLNTALAVLELQIELPQLLGADSETRLKALWKCEDLLKAGVESENAPLGAMQASIMRTLAPGDIPPEILAGFQERLGSLPERLRDMLKATVAAKPTASEIATLVESIPDAQDHQYLAYQTAPYLPALSNAIQQSVAHGDSELFFVASGAFAQPALGIETADSALPEQPDTKPMVKVTTRKGLETGVFEQVAQFSFARLSGVTIRQLQDCLGDTESALIVAGEPGSAPISMLVTKSAVTPPKPIDNWSSEALSSWKIRYMDGFIWKKPPGYLPGIDQLSPPIGDIKALVDGLGLGLANVPEYLTILPSAHLFGFTWGLSPHGDEFLAGATSLAIAPSPGWLVATRMGKPKDNRVRKAWIGSSGVNDPTLLMLRQYVEDQLKDHRFGISRDDWPAEFEASEIAFIGAHGGTGAHEYFRSISDRINYFSPQEVARMLSGCGCVILAVCSSGKSERQSGSQETLGLVSTLLRFGVRCVIAPPWPLDIEVVRHWLPTFLDALAGGKTVGGAACEAQDAVRASIDHPCAWGQLQVYGDQMFRTKT